MFDDDISKVELLSKQGEKITSSRILYEPEESPRFEYAALEIWYKIAKKYNLSLSLSRLPIIEHMIDLSMGIYK